MLDHRDAMIRLEAGSLGLPAMLQAAASSPARTRGSPDSCIYLFLWGGPPQQDTFDLKPDSGAGSNRSAPTCPASTSARN